MTKEKLEQLLFDGRTNAFALLDAAALENLRMHFFEMNPPHYCLFRGELAPDMAENAPYLVGLVRGERFTDWLLSQKAGNHYGVYAKSRQSLIEMRRHFRDLLTVHDEAGKPMIFRYYDPRVLSQFLPTCAAIELNAIFGSVESYIAETENGDNYSVFSQKDGALFTNLLEPKGD